MTTSKDDEPKLQLSIRHAQAEHLLKALNNMSKEDKISVTHRELEKGILLIKDAWEKLEKLRNKKNRKIRSKRWSTK